MLAESPATAEFELAEEQRQASLELAAPHLGGYEVLGLIGEGTYGDVWKAREHDTGVIVAVKRLRKQPDAQSCAEVEKLARLGAARGIVALREVHLATEPWCYVMEHLEGGTLADLIRRDKKLPLADAWRIFRQLNEALAYVHAEGIVHCDIKPENILLDTRGNPRLCDFGQARGRGPGGAALGTRFYMPPEQARLEGLPDPRWDVYALGSVFYELLTGAKPRYDIELASLMSSPTGSGSEVRDRLEKYARHLERCPSPQAHRKVQRIDSASARLIDDCLSIEFSDRPQDAAAVLKRMAQCEHARASKPLLIFGGLAPAVMLLAVGLIATIAGLVTLKNFENSWTATALDSNQAITDAIVEFTSARFEERMRVVEEAAADPQLREVICNDPQVGDEAALKALQGLFRRHRHSISRWGLSTSQALFINNWGHLGKQADDRVGIDEGSNGKYFGWRGWYNGVEDFAPHPTTPPTPQESASFQARQGKVFVAQPYLRVGDQNFLVVTISAPVSDVDGGPPAGVLSGSIYYDDFMHEVVSFVRSQERQQRHVIIVNDRHQIVYHPRLEAAALQDPKSFKVPKLESCALFTAAFAGNFHPGLNPDPIDGQACLMAGRVMPLSNGQRLAVFVAHDQRQALAGVWNLQSLVAVLGASLLVIGLVFLGTNSYALYWTLRQQRAASGREHAPLDAARPSRRAAVASEGPVHG